MAEPASPAVSDRRVADRQRFPDFFLAGHSKCGTTALYQVLREHPDIYMSPVKDPWYFCADGDIPPDMPRITTQDDYLALFAPASPGQLLGEASTSYLLSSTAAANIAAANPRARIIAIFREPAAFVRSSHQDLLRSGAERTADLRAALAQAHQRARWQRYPEHVRYVEQVERYRRHFPDDQILILLYEDYRRANAATIRRILRFLGVDDTVGIAPRESNRSTGVRSVTAASVSRRILLPRGRLGRGLKQGLRTVVPPSARSRAYSFYLRAQMTPPPPPDGELMAELREMFAPEVRKFGDYLGRDLSVLWGDR